MNIDLRLKHYATFDEQAWFETLSELQVYDVTIPKGFETDGASLPRWVIFTALTLILVGGLSSGILATGALLSGWFVILLAYLFPPFGKYTLAAFVHDKLLEETDRYTADRKMREILTKLGITSLWSKMMYRIVRINSVIKHREMGS